MSWMFLKVVWRIFLFAIIIMLYDGSIFEASFKKDAFNWRLILFLAGVLALIFFGQMNA